MVRPGDSELLGFLLPRGRGLVPTTVFGVPLAPALERCAALAVLEARGLAVLSEPWWCDGSAGRLVEVGAGSVRWSGGTGEVLLSTDDAADRLWPLATRRPDAVSAAVADNAAWCASVAAAQGVPSRRDETSWSAAAPMPAFFPSAVTLRPGVGPAAVLAAVPGGAVGVKDAFADLDLGPGGFSELLHGRWVAAETVARPAGGRERVVLVETSEQLAGFAAASVHESLDWAALQEDPTVDLVLVETFGQDGWKQLAQAVLSSGAGTGVPGAVGISNVEVAAGGSATDAWRAVGWFAARRFPDRLLVGWEPSADVVPPLLAGFVDVGPLRVWVR